MAGELYRTYEVLVEESVHPDHPKRQKTAKPGAWGDGSTYAALKDTTDILQDAVCDRSILLAGLAGDLNELWDELCEREKRPGNDVTKVLRRLAANYPHKLGSVTDPAGFCERAFVESANAALKDQLSRWRPMSHIGLHTDASEPPAGQPGLGPL